MPKNRSDKDHPILNLGGFSYEYPKKEDKPIFGNEMKSSVNPGNPLDQEDDNPVEPPKLKLYTPHPTEPSIFTGNPDNISEEWVRWNRARLLSPGNPFLKAPITNLEVMPALFRRAELRLELATLDAELPDEPPPLYTEGPEKHISLAWVMDTCLREKMSPEEAVTMGIALTKM